MKTEKEIARRGSRLTATLIQNIDGLATAGSYLNPR